jgi:molybdate transport system substrate-binding protein
LAGLLAALIVALLVISVLIVSCGGSSSPEGTGKPGGSAPVEIVVSAASDLAPVLDELAPLFEKETGMVLKANLGSTGQLMEQISAGARVDVFLAASSSAIQQLDEKGLLVPDSTRLYARGQLVMWTPPDSKNAVDALEDLADPAIVRISIANPDHAPYGRAARESLESAGLWDQLQPKVVPAENVRQAFQFAESGNVDVGLVALSLVIGGEGHYVVVPEDLHEPINQTLALIADGEHQSEAQSFVDYLTGPKGREILEKYGFVLPEE